MQKLQKHLSRWMLVYVVLAVGLGLGLGHPNAAWVKSNPEVMEKLTMLAVFFIIYPMMVNLKLESLLKAGKNVKLLGLGMLYNFVWGPVFGYLLARGLVSDPSLALGLQLATVVPCSSMSIGYTGLAKGNVELSTVTVALSFVVAVFAVPLWMAFFAAQYHVPIPMQDMLRTIIIVLVAPLILGFVTRLALVRGLGQEKATRIQPVFPAVSMLAMFAIVFFIFFGRAGLIIDKWQTVLALLVPEALFVGGTLLLVTLVNRRLGLSYRDHMAVVFASTGKNEGTAIAISAMAFTPLVAIAPATVPIFQILFLVLNVKLAGWLRRYFPEAPAEDDLAKSA
jgi:ACR3 family arsenite efflux pump ArsB